MRFIQTTHKDVKTFRNQAKKLSKQTGKKHVECLEVVAKKAGYDTWKHVCKCLKNSQKIDLNIKKQALEIIKNGLASMLGDFDKELAFAKTGVVLMYDYKDIADSNLTELIEDPVFLYAQHEFFYESMIYHLELESSNEAEYLSSTEFNIKELADYSADDLVNYFYDDMNSMDNIFFRFKQSDKYTDYDSVIKYCRELSFWMPEGIFIDGVYHDTYHLDAEDENGNTAGVRF